MVEILSTFPTELLRRVRPVLTKRPPSKPASNFIGALEQLFYIGREGVHTVNSHVAERAVVRLPIWHRLSLINVWARTNSVKHRGGNGLERAGIRIG